MAADMGQGIAADVAGSVWVAGNTYSSASSFPVRGGPGTTYNGRGDTVAFALSATADAGLPYLALSSLGTGPIPVDKRLLRLSADGLFFVSLVAPAPIFNGYSGVIDRLGRATAALKLPPDPGLIGLTIHTAFLTARAAAPSGIQSISNSVSSTIR